MTNAIKVIRGDLKVQGQMSSPVQTLTYASTITIDWDDGPKQAVTMTGSPQFNATSNATDGAQYVLYLIQDGTGSRSPTFSGSTWKFEGAVWPTFTSDADAVDMLLIEVKGTDLYCRPFLNFKNYTPS
jgi:hypothetical protein